MNQSLDLQQTGLAIFSSMSKHSSMNNPHSMTCRNNLATPSKVFSFQNNRHGDLGSPRSPLREDSIGNVSNEFKLSRNIPDYFQSKTQRNSPLI